MLVQRRLVSGATIFMILANIAAVTNSYAMDSISLLKKPTTKTNRVQSTKHIQAVMGPSSTKSVSTSDLWRKQQMALIRAQRKDRKRQSRQAFFAMGLMGFLKMFQIQHQRKMAQRQMYWERVKRQEQYAHELAVLRTKQQHQLQMLIIQLRARGYSNEEIKSIIRNEQVRRAVERTRRQPTFEGSIFNVPQVKKTREYYAGRASMVDYYLDQNSGTDSFDWYKEFKGEDVAAFDKLNNKAQYETIRSEIDAIKNQLRCSSNNVGKMLSNSVQGCDARSNKELLVARCNFVLRSMRDLENKMGVNLRSLEVEKAKIFSLRNALQSFDEISYGRYVEDLAAGKEVDAGARQEFTECEAQVRRSICEYLA